MKITNIRTRVTCDRGRHCIAFHRTTVAVTPHHLRAAVGVAGIVATATLTPKRHEAALRGAPAEFDSETGADIRLIGGLRERLPIALPNRPPVRTSSAFAAAGTKAALEASSAPSPP